MMQRPKHENKYTSLVQLRSNYDSAQKALQKVASSFLKAQSQRLGSSMLAAVALSAHDDPFTKVRKMIKDMIVKLMEEANDEAEHKGWCDTELSSNKQTRDTKTTG